MPRTLLSTALLGAILLGSHPAAAQVFCGATVTADATMTADLLCPNHDPALTVVGPATLDMNGHRLLGADSGHTGIALTGTGATLRDGAVREFATGVRLGGGGGHEVERVAAIRNSANGFVIDSGGNRIVDSTASGNLMHGFLCFAFALPGQENLTVVRNTIRDCSAVNNRLHGFSLGGAKGIYAGNVATANHDGGFAVFGTANALSGNVSSRNGGDGFAVVGLDNQLLDNLSAGDAGVAFRLPEQAGKRAKLVRNLAVDADAGIVGGTELRDNVVVGTRGHGIEVDAPGHKLIGNTVVAANGVGLRSLGGDSLVSKNRVYFTETGTGLMIGVAPDVQISGNSAFGSAIDVLDLDGTCDGHTWTGNLFTTSAQACVQ